MSQELYYVNESGPHEPPPAPADPAPPPPRREVTDRVRRRAWAEPHVRFWWVAMLALLAVAVYFLVSRYAAWRREADLVRNGLVVNATVMQAGTEPVPGKHKPPDSICKLRYEAGGQTYDVAGLLKGRKEHITVRSEVPLRIDSKDPTNWTALTRPTNLSNELLGGMLVLPVVALAAVVSVSLRTRLLRLWRDGVAAPALILDVRQTALAPGSRLVRCTRTDSDDHRVLGVYVPHARAGAHAGEALWLITPPGGGARAVAASWFE